MTTTEKSKLVVLNPTAAPREMVQTMAPVLDGLGGQSVGFLWNSKPNGDLLFERLEKLLREKYEIANVVYKRKPTASLPAKEEVIDELVGTWTVGQTGNGVTCEQSSNTQLTCVLGDFTMTATLDGATITLDSTGDKGTYTGDGVISWPGSNWIKQGKHNSIHPDYRCMTF